ncbi:MAG: carboxypeptidase regulatory-like domain-containing protein [Terriglobia bacterium]
MLSKGNVSSWIVLALAVAACLEWSAPARAQVSSLATLVGTVTDTSHAVVPQASVSVTNQGTGAQRTTVSNSDGSFAVPGLPVGTYTVKVSKSGFETFTESGLILHPALVATVNPVLSPGKVTTQVRVSASAVEVQTSTPEISSEVSGEQAAELPLNGRNYQSLAALMPGVTQLSPDTGLGLGGGLTQNVVSVNGMTFTGTMYYLDGLWNVGTGSFAENIITPNPDSIQEVRVLQNNYGVQYNLIGANVILLETKSGTSTFHGSLFEYLRNNALDARNFFAPTVPTLKQNIFGGTLGGPLFVPGHRSSTPKTFFFGTGEFERISSASVIQAAAPTVAMRNGVFPTTGPFAVTIKNPLTGQLFPNNTIPASMINPDASYLMDTLNALPNNPSGGFLNYLNLTPAVNDSEEYQLKVDHVFNDKETLMGEYMGMRQTTGPSPSPYDITKTGETVANELGQLQLTSTLTPSMVNTASVGLFVYDVNLTAGGDVYLDQVPSFSEKLPYHGYLSDRIPYVTFTEGYTAFGTNAPYPLPHAGDHGEMVSDDWAWLRGNHYIGAGVNVVHGGKKQDAFADSNGDYLFSGVFTGSPIADYLLGDSASFFQQSTEQRPYSSYTIASPYVQDRWKATRRLTVTGGLRVDHMPQPAARRGTLGSFDPADYNPADAPIVNDNGTITLTPNYNPLNGIVRNGISGIPLNLTDEHTWYWAPSAGFAWDVFGNGKTALRGGYGITYAMVPGNTDCSYECAGDIPDVASTSLVDAPFPDPIGAAAAPPTIESLGGAISGTTVFNLRASTVETYSLSLQHEFPGGWIASIAGAGVGARYVQEFENINQPLPDPPYGFNPAINTGTINAYVYAPYLGYGAMEATASNLTANWSALEVSVRHPVGHNLFFNVAYTWQHLLSNDSNADLFQEASGSVLQNVYNPSQNYGDSPDNNVPQILSFSAIWNLPWESKALGWRKQILGGWTYADMTTIQSGFSLSPGFSSATAGLAVYPNRVAGSSIVGPKTVNEWFNTSAFAAPAFGYFGNAAPGSIPGPGVVDFDMAFYKDFHITERNVMQFRAEAFNIFNVVNFSGVSTTLGVSNVGQLTSALDPRIFEFDLRFQF